MVDLYTGTVPNLMQSQPEFDENTQGILDYIAGLAPQLNEWVGAYVQDTTSASTTSNTIGTGSKTFAVEAGKGYKVNMPVRASATTGNYMDGVVTAYSGTSLTINFTSSNGSGTFTGWQIFLTIPGSNVTLGSNTFTGDQFVPDEAYDATGWNGDLSVPTKNAIMDKIELILSSILNATNDAAFSSTSASDPISAQWALGRFGQLRFGRTTSSGAYTPATGETLSRPHGLSVVPKSCRLVLRCLVSNLGYSVGETVCPGMYWDGTNTNAMSVYADATNCGIKCPASFNVAIMNKTSGVSTTPGALAWEYYFEFSY